MLPAPAEFLESADGAVGLQDHVAPVPAVATVRTSAGNELLPAEADDAVATVSGRYHDLHTVYHVAIIRIGLFLRL